MQLRANTVISVIEMHILIDLAKDVNMNKNVDYDWKHIQRKWKIAEGFLLFSSQGYK